MAAKQPKLRHDETLPRARRQASGAYYTPAHVARFVVEHALNDGPPAKQRQKILDPACGDGEFLLAVLDRLRYASADVSVANLIADSIFGIDRDAQAVAACRQRLAAYAGRAPGLREVLKRNIIVADALFDALPEHWPKKFTAIVGNPPYVNIRRLSQTPDYVARLRQRFTVACGSFDLYVAFLERAVELLDPEGCCGFVVPNRLLSADYAAACRQMLASRTQIDLLADFSQQRDFHSASVYPFVIAFRQKPAKPSHVVSLSADREAVPQDRLRTSPIWSLAPEASSSTAPTVPLRALCTLHSGTTGFVAQQMADALSDGETAEDGIPFITSGNIDRYQVTLGNVRFMKRRFQSPRLSLSSNLLTERKRKLFREPKLVFAGMSRRLEVAWHEQPLALGVQVFAAAELQIDPYYLLAVLNSRFISDWYRAHFSARQLSGGYLAIHKRHLEQIPIVDPRQGSQGQRTLVAKLSTLGRKLTERYSDALDHEVDRLVAQLYAGDEKALPAAA
jgi:methylase of polypeptide subunit release factors